MKTKGLQPKRPQSMRSWLLYSSHFRQIMREKGIAWTAQRCIKCTWNFLIHGTPVTYSARELSSVLIEVTTYCNMKCSGCYRTLQIPEGKWKNRHMAVQDFRSIVDTLPPVGELVAQGVGEPVMHPNLPELIRIAYSTHKFATITLTTNAMARDIDYYTQLFTSGLTTLFISVDSLDQALANRLRAGTSVDKLKERIHILASRFPKKIAVRTVVGRENIASIPETLAELDKLGKIEVHMHPYDDLGDASGCLSLKERASFAQQIPDIVVSFRNLRVTVNNIIPSFGVCPLPWRAPAITVDGYLTPCCRIVNKDVFNFGNVISCSFHKIWYAPETEQWRKRFMRKSPSICIGCPWYVER